MELIFCSTCETNHEASEFKIWLSDKTKARRCDRMYKMKHTVAAEKPKPSKRQSDEAVTQKMKRTRQQLEAIKQAKEDKLIDDEHS